MVVLDDWQLVGPIRCVIQWYHQRGWCHMWVYIETGWSLWGRTITTTSPSCYGTSPSRTEASTLVLDATPKRRARTTVPSSPSLWWTSVSGQSLWGRGLIYSPFFMPVYALDIIFKNLPKWSETNPLFIYLLNNVPALSATKMSPIMWKTAQSDNTSP